MYMHVLWYIRVCIRVCIYNHPLWYMYICIHVYIYIHTHTRARTHTITHRHTHTHTQTHTDTDRHTLLENSFPLPGSLGDAPQGPVKKREKKSLKKKTRTPSRSRGPGVIGRRKETKDTRLWTKLKETKDTSTFALEGPGVIWRRGPVNSVFGRVKQYEVLLPLLFFLLLQCVLLLLQGIGRQIVRQLVRRSKMTGFWRSTTFRRTCPSLGFRV